MKMISQKSQKIVLKKKLRMELALLIQKIVKKMKMVKIVKNVMEVLIVLKINVYHHIKIVDFVYMRKIVKNVKVENVKIQMHLIVKINQMMKNVKN